MNVYDFDKTIYDGDSTVDFWLWAVAHDPSLLRFVPGQLRLAPALACGRATLGDFKGGFLSYVRGIDDLDGLVRRFWREHAGGLKGWYLLQRRPDDVVVSASPDFLLRPLCDAMGVELIATEADSATGRLLSPNCKGAEKVTRFRALHPDARVERFYSDSHSDAPLAALAEEAWLVKRDTLLTWR